MPCSLRRQQESQDVVDLGMGQPGHRLVGDQQLGLGRHGAGQFELAHLDLGQVARPPAGLVGEPDLGAAAPRRALLDRGIGKMRARAAH